jgi:hypothetical protein
MLERFALAAPPTLTLPRKGGGNERCGLLLTPSPLTGDGWGGGGPQEQTHE